MSLLDGSQNRRQRAWAWAEPPHVVVANPLTLEKMLATGGLRCANVKVRLASGISASATAPDPPSPLPVSRR
jgi:hypothetical protein